MKQYEVRRMYIQHNPGVRRWGKKGYWYKCAHCGKWCGRAGGEHAGIKESELMEVDHIRPWSNGGSNEIWNLQTLCRPCNRKKSNNTTLKDNLKIAKNNLVHGDFITSGIRESARNNKVLKVLGITSRK